MFDRLVIFQRLRARIDWLRARVAHTETLAQLAMLGVVCGLLSGVVIIAFRLLIEGAQGLILPESGPESYEDLSVLSRFLLPLAGGVLLGLLFHFLTPDLRQVGVVHILDRLASQQGRLPGTNAVVQFIGGAISIACGHSVGREGPSIHLGAASGSLAGQALGVRSTSLRVLAGCGVAAAIAAAFNTPLAGVVFAMEVVMMEYSVAGFAPVILAAVSATALSQLMYGSAPAFEVPSIAMGSLLELPYILAMGIVIGMIAASFILLVRLFATRFAHWPVWRRLSFAGALVGMLAVPIPQIMSVGYDTVNAALVGNIVGPLLAGILVFKLVATAASVGLGLPGGLIGPSLVLGAAAGGVIGLVGQSIAPTEASSSGLYALLGMGAMMASVLQAPLSALIAVLELTDNPNVLMPGMLAIITATLTSRILFRQPSVYTVLLRANGPVDGAPTVTPEPGQPRT